MRMNNSWMKTQKLMLRANTKAWNMYDNGGVADKAGIIARHTTAREDDGRRVFAFDSTTQKNSQGRFHHIANASVRTNVASYIRRINDFGKRSHGK